MFSAFYIIAGVVLLVVGAECLVRGASAMAASFGVSPLVIGLTIVAFGTSAPELAVSVVASFSGQPDLTVGNVVGSNIFNVLAILGSSALVVPLVVHQKLIRFDVPLMIAVSVLFLWFSQDQVISQGEGVLMFAGVIAYTVFCLLTGRDESAEVQQEYAQEFSEEATDIVVAESNPVRSKWLKLSIELVLVLVGAGMLVLGSRLLVDGAVEICRRLGVSELVIGLTVIAAGTSLPELATSVMAALRNERDIAVGNVVGSNLFNILAVLGLSSAVSPGGIPVTDQAINFDIPVMVAVAVACLPVFFTGGHIARWEGGLFFAYYFLYAAALVLIAVDSEHLPAYRTLMFWFVIPLSVVTLLVMPRGSLASEKPD